MGFRRGTSRQASRRRGRDGGGAGDGWNSGCGAAGAAAGIAGQRRSRRGDQHGAQRLGRGPDQRGRRRRRADRRQAGGAVGDLPPAGGRGRQGPGLLPLVRGRRVDDARQRHGRRPLERGPAVHGLAELRPGSGRRGPGDRLRRRRADGAVGDLVRETRPAPASANEQRVRQPLRQHRRRQPGQVDLRRPEPRQRRRGRARPVAEHPHRPGRREPVGGRRLGGRPDQAGSVGHLAGDRRRPNAQGPDLRRPADRARGSTNCDARDARRASPTAPATCRRSAASAGSRPGSRGSAAGGRPEPERRPDARRRSSPTSRSRAPTTAFRGSSGTSRTDTGHQRPDTTTRWCSRPRAISDGVGRQRRLPLGRGRQPAAAARSTPAAHQPLRRVRRVGDRRGRSAR